MQDQIDFWLTIVDIFLCLVDIALIIYLFFFKFPAEMKKRIFTSRIAIKNNKKKFLLGVKAATKKRG